LTLAVFITRKDFSFLGPILSVAGFLMLGIILIAVFFPASFNLGMWFSVLAIALACGYILYDTSNVIHHFRTDQHVAASLELFASVAYLLYYVIVLLAQAKRD
jgi:FtsH-binding integral membrane protein